MQLPQQDTNHFERMPDELVLKVLPRPRGQTMTAALHVYANQEYSGGPIGVPTVC